MTQSFAIAQAQEIGILSKEVHGKHFTENLDRFAKTANIPVGMIMKPMSDFCGKEETKFVVDLHEHIHNDIFGLNFQGSSVDYPVPTRMMAMAGACLRNFLDARVRNLGQALAAGSGDLGDILFIPDFCGGNSSTVADWDIPKILSLLIDRQAQGLLTIVCSPGGIILKKFYGASIANHVAKYFGHIQVS